MKAVANYMLSRGEIQGSTPDQHLFHKLCTAVHACNSSIQELEAGRLEVQGHPRPQSKFEASLEYMGPCLKI